MALPSPLLAIESIDEPAQLPTFFLGESRPLYQVGQEGRERAAAERIRDRPQPPADQLVAVDRRPEDVHWAGPVAADAALRFEPIEQLLDRGVDRGPTLLVDPLDQL